MFQCDTCNVTMTGQDQYNMHMEGKKHAKKLKSLGLPAGKMFCYVYVVHTPCKTSKHDFALSKLFIEGP